jgi:hypothetical protein
MARYNCDMRLGLAAALAIASLRADGQETTALTTVARRLYGDVAVIVQVAPNQVRLAIDDGKTNLVLSFVGTDVRRWADSTTRYFSRRRRKADSTMWSSALHEPGLRSGTASLTIRIDSAGPTHTLFFADDSLITVRGLVEPDEARAFTNILRTASVLALGDRRESRPAAARRRPPKPPPG